MRTARVSLHVIVLAIGAALLVLMQTPSAAGIKPKAAETIPGRVALVIGNGTYKNVTGLKNAVADAGLIGDALTSIGFDVTLKTDLDLATFNDVLREFARKISAIEKPTVVFYYAGHGAQIKGRNYFFPTDIKFTKDPIEAIIDAVDVNQVVDWVEKGNGSGTNLFLFDGCRDNPWESGARLEASVAMPKGVIGLNKLGDNSIVIFSTAPGAEAVDQLTGGGDENNSPFARALAANLVDPNVAFVEFFRRTQFEVIDRTFGRQKPSLFGTISEGLKLFGGSDEPLPPPDALTAASRVALAEGSSSFLYSGSYALLIGVSDYQDRLGMRPGWADLPGVKNDIKAVDEVLRTRHGFETKIVMEPTSEGLQAALRDFFSVHGRKEDARLLIYYAGHGATTVNHGVKIGWVVPADAPNADAYPEEFALTAFSMRRVQEFSEFVKAKHMLWVFDSCFSGSIFAMQSRGAEPATWDNSIYKRPVRRVLTAGSEKEVVPDNSIFAALFVDALGGKKQVGSNRPFFSGNELGEFLRREVYKYREGHQTPQNGTVVIRGLDEGDVLFRMEDALAKPVAAGPAAAVP